MQDDAVSVVDPGHGVRRESIGGGGNNRHACVFLFVFAASEQTPIQKHHISTSHTPSQFNGGPTGQSGGKRSKRGMMEIGAHHEDTSCNVITQVCELGRVRTMRVVPPQGRAPSRPTFGATSPTSLVREPTALVRSAHGTATQSKGNACLTLPCARPFNAFGSAAPAGADGFAGEALTALPHHAP